MQTQTPCSLHYSFQLVAVNVASDDWLFWQLGWWRDQSYQRSICFQQCEITRRTQEPCWQFQFLDPQSHQSSSYIFTAKKVLNCRHMTSVMLVWKLVCHWGKNKDWQYFKDQGAWKNTWMLRRKRWNLHQLYNLYPPGIVRMTWDGQATHHRSTLNKTEYGICIGEKRKTYIIWLWNLHHELKDMQTGISVKNMK
jgi:hypothetical protein